MNFVSGKVGNFFTALSEILPDFKANRIECIPHHLYRHLICLPFLGRKKTVETIKTEWTIASLAILTSKQYIYIFEVRKSFSLFWTL